MTRTAAQTFGPVFRALLGAELPLGIRYWDGSTDGPDGGVAEVVFHTPRAMRRFLYSPDEVGLARAYILEELTIEGDELAALRALVHAPDDLRIPARELASALAGAARLGVLGAPLAPPPEEVRVRGRLHSRRRDREAVTHHYELGNDFYRLLLGPSMTYSCARFVHPDDSLETAQAAKYDLICRKLGLVAGMRLLDVGCGWGGMVMHAATHHGVEAVGLTISPSQLELGRTRVAEAGLEGRVEIRLQDYRDLDARSDRFQAVSSIGMFEHVGRARMVRYFETLAGLLEPHGRLLNHAISTPEGSANGTHSFLGRYVFPDGELQDVGTVAEAMQDQGLEIRDVEGLREHYPLTLRSWLANLEARWDEAVGLIGPRRARIWRLYLMGTIANFEAATVGVHQVLSVRVAADGSSGMPLTRPTLV
ncbi:MAG: cyclopropane-fatty-acyl-phospholipid synthase family protein [Actinomycetota bacterium]|nr:cyclopropane-fatty-acyl-phospholipid synthase family protein [Actinomycetota bacterium]